VNFPGSGFLPEFAAGSDGCWMAGPAEPGRAFLGQNPSICFIFLRPMSIATKKAFWGAGRESSIPVGSISASFFPLLLQPPLLPPPPERCHRLFPALFPADARIGEAGGSGEGSAGFPPTVKSGFGGGWQGGLSLFIRAQAVYSHGFLTRRPVNSRIPQTEEALAYFYCVLALAP